MIRLMLFCLCFFWTNLSFAQTNTGALFQKANDAYQRNDFVGAIDNYQKIIVAGQHSPETYYNLGNAHYKLDQIGKAILNYERALNLSPHNEDIAYNLSLAKEKTKDDIQQISSFFLSRFWRETQKMASASVWGMVGIFMFWLGIAGLIIWLIGPSREAKKWGFIGGLSLIALTILPILLGFSKAKFEQNSGQAIIIEKSTILRSSPDENSTRILELHEGTKVDILDAIGDWNNIQLANGEQGWLRKEVFEVI